MIFKPAQESENILLQEEYKNKIFVSDDNTVLNENIIADINNKIDSVKQNAANTAELKKQWKQIADTFVNHKWIYRYINDQQKEALEKHYEKLTNEKTYYSVYKRSFNTICKFMGLDSNMVIIENMVFDRAKEDKYQWMIAVRFSKGLLKVQLPEGVHLVHISPVPGITALNPSFRSKVKGKYMYPNRRVFFSIAKDIRANQAGLEGQTYYRYTPTSDIRTAYIDPTYASFAEGCVYVETEVPIPVTTMEKKFSINTLFNAISKPFSRPNKDTINVGGGKENANK